MDGDIRIAEPIFAIEQKHPELYNLSYGQLKIWTILRFILRIRATNPAVPATRDVLYYVRRFKVGIAVLIKALALMAKPFVIFSRYDVVIFTNRFEQRRFNNQVIDKLSSGIIEQYERIGKKVLVINYSGNAVQFARSAHLDGLRLLELVQFFYPGYIHRRQAGNISRLLKDAGLVSNARDVIKELNNYAGLTILFRKLFRIWKPRYVFMPDYSCFAEIFAANSLGIETFELQHGNINEHHPGYFSLSPIDRDFYSRSLLLFGENSIVDKPGFVYSKEQMHVIGNYYLSVIDQLAPLDGLGGLSEKFETRICIPYDSTDEKYIFSFLTRAISLFPDVLFVFSIRYAVPASLSNLGKICRNVLIDTSTPFQVLVKNCDFNLCSFSTCALEALALGRPNILVTTDPRTEAYYKGKLDEKFSFFIGKAEDIYEVLKRKGTFDPNEIKRSNSKNIAINYQENLESFISAHA